MLSAHVCKFCLHPTQVKLQPREVQVGTGSGHVDRIQVGPSRWSGRCQTGAPLTPEEPAQQAEVCPRGQRGCPSCGLLLLLLAHRPEASLHSLPQILVAQRTRGGGGRAPCWLSPCFVSLVDSDDLESFF